MLDATHRVRDLAYQIWETEGCPAGRETEHWLEAERRVIAEGGSAPVQAKASANKTTAKSGTATTAKAGRSKKRA